MTQQEVTKGVIGHKPPGSKPPAPPAPPRKRLPISEGIQPAASIYVSRCVLRGRLIQEVETALAYESTARYTSAEHARREAFNTLEEIGIRNLIVDPGVTR